MTKPIAMPRFLDVEASSLSMDSYPVEIAWSDPLGKIESYLINPYAIEAWTDWDYNSQQIHGISRKQCREDGLHPEQLCRIMSQSIQPGETIYADGGNFDANWVDILYEYGNDRSGFKYAQFYIKHSDEVMFPLLTAVEPDEKKCWQLYEQLKLKAREQVNGRHRAKVDVEYLLELWRLCIDYGGVASSG
ncbi:MAG: hypothetical protein K9L22_08330 [Methylococcaceae bacterium]|nr:hypothetical protein [Methylococcaceae bacterium]